MDLHLDREAFHEIIALAADKFAYEQSHVEKDYWVSKILHDIALSEYADRTYFKGGTSLSKAYGLIDRFSEDLDLFVFTGDKFLQGRNGKINVRDVGYTAFLANDRSECWTAIVVYEEI